MPETLVEAPREKTDAQKAASRVVRQSPTPPTTPSRPSTARSNVTSEGFQLGKRVSLGIGILVTVAHRWTLPQQRVGYVRYQTITILDRLEPVMQPRAFREADTIRAIEILIDTSGNHWYYCERMSDKMLGWISALDAVFAP